MKYVFIATCLTVICSSTSDAKHLHYEKWYQEQWCQQNNGVTEYRLPDGTRCDCLTASHAVEVDFAPKWHEAIGQALYYSMQTGKRAGIVLIVEKRVDKKHWIRLNSVIQYYHLPITTWEVTY